MITVAFRTKRDQEAILDEAAKYFGDKVGLKIAERSPCCVFFGDYPRSYVRVTLSKEDKGFEVIVESKEYEHWARRFFEEFRR